MSRGLLRWNFALPVLVSICALTLASPSLTPALWAQAQLSSAQYPPGRPQPIAMQCQNALTDRVSADAGRRVSLNLDTQNLYPAPNGRQGIRGRLRYGLGGRNSWRTANYDCMVDPRSNRVERATYSPRANNTGWPGPGPGPSPGIPNYPRVRVDTAMRGRYNSRSGSFTVNRGYVDSRGARPSVSLRGDNFRMTFYGVVENSVGGGFTMRITGSDRGDARGSAQVRFNRDLNEIDSINLSGRIGRDDFSGNFTRR